MRTKTCQGFKSMILNRNFVFHARQLSAYCSPPQTCLNLERDHKCHHCHFSWVKIQKSRKVYSSALQSFAFRDWAVRILKSSDFLQISSSDASAPRPWQCLFCLSCLWVNTREQPLLIGTSLAIRAGREMVSEAWSQRPEARGQGDVWERRGGCAAPLRPTSSKVYQELKQHPLFALLSPCTIIPYIPEISPSPSRPFQSLLPA